MRILLVEDEAHIATGLVFNFGIARYHTDVAETGEQGLDLFDRNEYDLIVLDVMLPGMNGFQFAREIRRKDGHIPILMLTALSADEDRVAGLESGVDDYVTKPFVLRELLLRIAGLLRRSKWNAAPLPSARQFRLADVTIDADKLIAQRGDQVFRITRIEADLLYYFASNPDRVVSREELLLNVWGYGPDVNSRTVDTFVMRARKIVELKPSKPKYLVAVRGEGYRYQPGNQTGDS